MSELQISLLAIGLLIVAGVYGFNRFQERKHRRRAEQAFPSGHEDVLLREGGAHASQDIPQDEPGGMQFREGPRIEPVVTVDIEEPWAPEEIVEAESIPAPEPVKAPKSPATHHEDKHAAQLDEIIDYVVKIHPGEPVSAAAANEAVQHQGEPIKHAHWLGLNPNTGGWEKIGEGDAEEYHQLAATLQLASRSGPVSSQELTEFCNWVQSVADKLAAIAEFPDKQPALTLAMALDQFGADVDVLIGVNVITHKGDAFSATKVRALAESAGMKLQPDGAFHFFNDEGDDLFSLSNLDPAPFSAENIRHLSTHGITFLFDVPKVADGVRVFNQMLVVARQMATTLGGQVVDDNRKPLSDAGVGKIKEQLADIYAKMEAQQIRGGSVRALRLFS